MTIKPIVLTQNNTTKRGSVIGSGGDAEAGGVNNSKKDSTNVETNCPQNVVGRNVGAGHRNVVIDGHRQSPQRFDVFDDMTRHCRSPNKSRAKIRREHHQISQHDHHKRDWHDREKHLLKSVTNNALIQHNANAANVNTSGVSGNGAASGTNAAHVIGGHVSAGNSILNSNITHNNASVELGSCQGSSKQQATVTQSASNLVKAVEEKYSGYNSGDEHLQPKEFVTADEWQRRDEQFAKCIAERGYELRPVEEDGACLFRAISLQIYGDEEMHDVIRQHTMDYIYKNRDYFRNFVTEDINSYIKRKRRKDSHGNHIELQAISEIYSRPVELYCYKPTPINIFNQEQLNNGYAPLRLSYQRGSHYNAILDPYNATVGVGLGMSGFKPELQTKEAMSLSEQLEIEQTMFEDKLKSTDWEATNEAIEEQIARESYLQWCCDNLQRSRSRTSSTATTTSTITSSEMKGVAHDQNTDSILEASPSKYACKNLNFNIIDKPHPSDGSGGSSSSSNSEAADIKKISEKGGATKDDLIVGDENQKGAIKDRKSLEAYRLSGDMQLGNRNLAVPEITNDYESDDTDMSTTSSVSGFSTINTMPGSVGDGGDEANENAANSKISSTRRGKKVKLRHNVKKRRRDSQQFSKCANNANELEQHFRNDNSGSSTICGNDAINIDVIHNCKSPKNDGDLVAGAVIRDSDKNCHDMTRFFGKVCEDNASDVCQANSDNGASKEKTTPSDPEQQPCSSKQLQPSIDDGMKEKSPLKMSGDKPLSSFYQDLLESSYAADGLGQLSETEMLQRAIQMSTQDYIEDQKRRYLYSA